MDPVAALMGVPVVVDGTLPPGAWRVLDGDGNVLAEHNTASGDGMPLLDRIDSLLDEWERHPDAYRWSPQDSDHIG